MASAALHRLVGCLGVLCLLLSLSVAASLVRVIAQPIVWKLFAESGRTSAAAGADSAHARWVQGGRRGRVEGEVARQVAAVVDEDARKPDHDDDGDAAAAASPDKHAEADAVLGEHPVDEKLAQGLVQAGFSYARAKEALSHVGSEGCCGPESPQAKYIFSTSSDAAIAADHDALMARETHIMEHTDLDGFAIVWGSGNIKESVEECAEACKNLEPTTFAGVKLPCNAFSYCPNEKCFTPAAGVYTKGQCWLKWQEGVNDPQVNMQGAYDAEYHRRHPNAPDMVDWHGGVVVPAGTAVTNGRPSARWGWR